MVRAARPGPQLCCRMRRCCGDGLHGFRLVSSRLASSTEFGRQLVSKDGPAGPRLARVHTTRYGSPRRLDCGVTGWAGKRTLKTREHLDHPSTSPGSWRWPKPTKCSSPHRCHTGARFRGALPEFGHHVLNGVPDEWPVFAAVEDNALTDQRRLPGGRELNPGSSASASGRPRRRTSGSRSRGSRRRSGGRPGQRRANVSRHSVSGCGGARLKRGYAFASLTLVNGDPFRSTRRAPGDSRSTRDRTARRCSTGTARSPRGEPPGAER